MSRHLPAERIAAWMMGERDANDERHLRECAGCAAEVARLESDLAMFRGSVRRWSERQGAVGPPAVVALRPAWSWFRPWPLWAAAAVLMVAAAVPVYRGSRHLQAKGGIGDSDALLLVQVDAQVSRSVPRPMEPLLQLVSWDLSSHRNSNEKEDDETTKQK
jgi:hypothetical protein